MYDLLTDEENLTHYTRFRKNLLKMGFIMVQESVYSKIYPHHMSLKIGMQKVRSIAPSSGNIRMLYLTEKQYSEIEMVSGNKSEQEKIVSDSRYQEV